MFSHPDITAGSNYTVQCGEEQTEVAMDTLVYGSGQGMHGGFHGHGNRAGRNRVPEGEPPELPDGQTPPDLPDGQMPENGQELLDLPDGQTPENGAELPQMQDGQASEGGTL